MRKLFYPVIVSLLLFISPLFALNNPSSITSHGEINYVSTFIRNPIAGYQLLLRSAPKIIDVLEQYPEARDRAKIVAVLLSYYGYITHIAYQKNSATFYINDEWVYYADGKLLNEEQLQNASRYRPIIYNYDITPLNINEAKPVPNTEYIDVPRSSALFLLS